MKKSVCFAWLLIFGFIFPAGAQPFTLVVTHKHFRGHCTGKLIISDDGIQYAPEYVKHQRKWSYLDLKGIEIASRRELNVETYEDKKHFLGADREFKFKVIEGEVTAEMYQFLLAKSTRPLIAGVPFATAQSFAYTIPVKHRHFRGGCQGELKIGDNQVVYETSYPKHSRIWLYKDVETIGLTDPYNFRLTTVLETYTFDVKVAMTAEQYDYLWRRIYRLQNQFSAGNQSLQPCLNVLGRMLHHGVSDDCSNEWRHARNDARHGCRRRDLVAAGGDRAGAVDHPFGEDDQKDVGADTASHH